MKFSQAYKEMRDNNKKIIKLGSECYWYWNPETSAIMCVDSKRVEQDIRTTTDMDYSLMFSNSLDWRVLTEEELKVFFEPAFNPLKIGDKGPLVADLQFRLNAIDSRLTIDGDFGPSVERTVRDFQYQNKLPVTGIVDGVTNKLIIKSKKAIKLSKEDLVRAAVTLDTDTAAVMAVSEIESNGSGFLLNGKPVILYERHWMHRRLAHHGIDPKQYSDVLPAIVNSTPGGYTSNGNSEHARLSSAMEIDATSALESTSWGLYQIMGFHWKTLGYKSVEQFVDLMSKAEAYQLEAFIKFIKSNNSLWAALKNKDFAAFAKIYNGPAYAKNKYDTKLEQAYIKYTRLLA